MSLILRHKGGTTDLTVMGYTHTDDRFGARVAVLEVINPEPEKELAPLPRAQYKGKNLDELTMNGGICPVDVSPIPMSVWTSLDAFLRTEPDPILRLTESTDGVESDRGYYYAVAWSLERPSIVAGVPSIQRWRLTIRERPPP